MQNSAQQTELFSSPPYASSVFKGRNRLSLNLTRQLFRPNNPKLSSACYCPFSTKEAYMVQQDQAETLTSSNTNPDLCFCLNTPFFHGILPEII